MTRLIDKIDDLHNSYAAAIDMAVKQGDLPQAEQLAAQYESDSILLVAQHEGREDLLGHFGLTADGQPLAIVRATPVARLLDWLGARKAA